MKFMSFLSRFGKGWRQRKATGRRPAGQRPNSPLLGIEELEARNLMSVLPATVVNGQATFGGTLNTGGLSPQVAVDPLNPLKLAMVSSNGAHGFRLLASANGVRPMLRYQ